MAASRIELISRQRCHLCEEAEKLLAQLQSEQSFVYEVLDVDSDPSLHLYYTHRVPVLRIDGREVAELVFSVEKVRAQLRALGQ
ncbi:MAG TPA: glutaredoxin family protein [Pseudomonadota bacterium]|nr:glutaredoxin family protein [Pseudomonadota bacterium]